MDSSLRYSSEIPPNDSKETQPIQIPSLVDIILATLMRHKSRISSLDMCSVADASPVLISLTVEQLKLIESNTKRDLQIDPHWDQIWQAQCAKLSLSQVKNTSWRKTWELEELKRKKYAAKSKPIQNQDDSKCMTAAQVDIMKARETWLRKMRSGPPLEPAAMPNRKKAKYK